MSHSLEPAPDRDAGLARLREFVHAAGSQYAETRNTDRGPLDRGNVSRLSGHIRRRLVTEPEVLSAVLARHSPAGAEKFIQEVFWRTYWKGYLEMRPGIRERYLARLAAQGEALHRGGFAAAYTQAVEGRTGIDVFDAAASELVETGYLHNHMRMWFASIWIFTLRLPWELGADFFLTHLIDGDVASNTLSWRWVGGLHTRGKTYLATRENISRHTEGRFYPRGLARTAEPLDESAIDTPRSIAPSDAMPEGQFDLLLTEDDLGVETLATPPGRVRRIGVVSSRERSARGPGDAATRFSSLAIADTLARVRALHPEAEIAEAAWSGAEPDDVAAFFGGDLPVVTPWSPVGANADAVAAVAPALRGGLLRVRRGYDSRAWPFASRGFFQFRERIPELLGAEGIVDGQTRMFAPKDVKPVVRRFL
jgi:deoxyribodipyrimidine photo-lyase